MWIPVPDCLAARGQKVFATAGSNDHNGKVLLAHNLNVFNWSPLYKLTYKLALLQTYIFCYVDNKKYMSVSNISRNVIGMFSVHRVQMNFGNVLFGHRGQDTVCGDAVYKGVSLW